MKFDSLNPEKVNIHKIRSFDGGINLLSDARFIADNQLSKCNNMWHKNGVLKTRPAVDAEDGQIIERADQYSHAIHPFRMTDVWANVNGKNCVLSYSVDSDDISYDMLRVFFVNQNGAFTAVEPIIFARTSSECFYRFDSVFFYHAEPDSGGGIYAFLTLDNGGDKNYCVYEISADFSLFSMKTVSDFYIPIIYMNGQGTAFGSLPETAICYGAEPVEPESLNMLNPRFKAYFTSDSYSDTFKLPVSYLDNSSVICRVYYSPGIYTEFNVAENSSSAVNTMYTYTVTFSIDRTTGIFRFTVPEGGYTVPYMETYGGNNIEIYASKTVPNSEARIIGSKRCTVYNSRIYLCGNTANPNEVYSARLASPLYFPKNGKVSVGESGTAVEAIGVVCNKLIVFKPNEIYRISVSSGDTFTPDGILSGHTADFLHTDTLVTTPVHTSIGCDCPETLQICSNRLVWCSSDGKAYTMQTTTYGKENNIYELSALVRPMLSEFTAVGLKNAVAFDADGYYILVSGNKAAVMDYRIKNFGYSAAFSGAKDSPDAVSWYLWELPEELYRPTAARFGNKTVIACNNETYTVQYTALTGEGKDILVTSGESGNPQNISYDIKCGFSTAAMDFGASEVKKSIDGIFVTAGCKSNMQVILDGGKEKSYSRIRSENINSFENIKILPFINSAEYLKIDISSDDSFSVGDLLIKYRTRQG